MQLYRKKRLREERVFNIIVLECVFQSNPFEVEKKKDKKKINIGTRDRDR